MDTPIEKVYQAGLRLLGSLDMDETYKVIVEEAIKLVNAKDGTILLMKNGELVRVYATNPVLFKIQPRQDGYNYRAYKAGEPTLVRIKQISKVHPEFRKFDIRSILIVPLTNKGKTIGVLSVHSKEQNTFSQNDLRIFKLFTPMASLAIRKNELYDEVNKALEARDLFIAMASHELRTPLTAVNGYINLIESAVKSQNNTLSRWVEALSIETQRLTLLVKELLEVNRLKLGSLLHYHFRVCHLVAIVQRAVSTFKFVFGNRQISLEIRVKDDDKVIGDYDKLLQCLTNLLENAAKFSPENKRIHLGLKEKRKELVITVEDKGVGIKKEELTEVLKNFVRGSNTTKEGMGLGLYLVNDIIIHHQGDLKIKSKVGKGTKIEITLPKANI